MRHIIETSQKMHEEAKRRKLKYEEKKNIMDLNDTEDSVYKYMKNINFGPYNFVKNDNEKIEYKNNISNKLIINNYNDYNINLKNKNEYNNNKLDRKKRKKLSVTELNNKRFEKKFQINKINNDKYLENNRYIFSNNYINSDDKKTDNNIVYIYGKCYNLEEERKILIQMAEHKNLYGRNISNIQLKNERKDNFRKTYNIEADKLIYEFFLRQLDW